MKPSPCATCEEADGPASGYDHVHHVDSLPRIRREDDHRLFHGYAVHLGGPRTGRSWTFFYHLEPALVFGRAGRMSAQFSVYGVHRAAHELRYRPGRGDEFTLHVLEGTPLQMERKGSEAEDYRAWIAGCDPASAHFTPPRGR